VRLTRLFFPFIRRLFGLRTRFATTYEERDRAFALYAPLSLVTLPLVWLSVVLGGYTAMFWSLGVQPLYRAFLTSGSSLLTLGFATTDGVANVTLAFTEAGIGLVLLALLITYLPSMYGAFARVSCRSPSWPPSPGRPRRPSR